MKWFVFSWENTLGHECVVLGVQDLNDHNKLHKDYGFITMELWFNETTNKVFPHAKYTSVKEAINENYYHHESLLPKYNFQDAKDKCKWKLHFKTTSIELIHFRNLALNLIKKHGKYDKVLNNCTDFVYAFFSRIYYNMRGIQQDKQDQRYENKLKNDQTYQKYKNNTNIMGSVVRKYKESSLKSQAEEEVEVWPSGYEDYKPTADALADAQLFVPILGTISSIATQTAWLNNQKEKWSSIYLGQPLIGTLSDVSDDDNFE